MATSAPNVPQIQKPGDFRSLINKGHGLASVCRFVVNIISGTSMDRDLSFLCSNAQLPGRAFNTGDEFRTYGPTFSMPFKSAYQPIDLTFICRDKMEERKFFDVWLELINPKSTYDFSYRDTYCKEINIFQLSQIATGEMTQEATYWATLRRAWPVNVQAQALDWAQDNYQRLVVTFTYTDFITEINKDKDLNTPKADKFDLVYGARIINNSLL